jgi:hypothetical protein
MRTKEEIQAQRKKVLEENNHYPVQTGYKTFLFGMLAWFWVFVVFSGIASVTFTNWSWWYIPASIVAAILAMFSDSENVKRNTLTTVENRFTNKEFCNFEKGRHWTLFFFLRKRKTYKNTPYEITMPIRETNCADDIGVNAVAKLTVQLVDGLAFEDAGGEKARQLLGTEARDASEAYIRSTKLKVLEEEKNDDLTETISEQDELEKITILCGHVIIKSDLIDLTPNDEYQKERRKRSSEKARAKGKKIESDQRRRRIATAKKWYLENGAKDENEALRMATDQIDKEDGFKKEEVKTYKGLKGDEKVIIN